MTFDVVLGSIPTYCKIYVGDRKNTLIKFNVTKFISKGHFCSGVDDLEVFIGTQCAIPDEYHY